MRALTFPALSLVFLAMAEPASADSWKPIPPEDLALTQGRVDADADAEVLEWQIDVADDWTSNVIRSTHSERRRIKIFNTRGRDACNRVEIPYQNGARIEDIAARTIRPDGSVIVAKKDAILDRTVLKAAGAKMKAMMITLPGVEPGCIVEYRWTVVDYDRLSHQLILPLQLEIPIERIVLTCHPIKNLGLQMRVRSFNTGIAPPTPTDPSTDATSIVNVKAYKKEPYAPPELASQPWIVIYYVGDTDEYPVADFWKRYGAAAWTVGQPYRKVSGDVKRAAAEALHGETEPSAMVDNLVRYCRSRLRNSDVSDSGLSAADRAWLDHEHSADDLLKRGLADSFGVTKVFLALANAAGFDARLAFVPPRDVCSFRSDEPTPYLLSRVCAAVNVFGVWRAVDPSAGDLAPDLLPWPIQGVDMFVPDDKRPTFVRTPVGTPEQTVRRHIARLALSEEGTLEGDVTDELTGQEAASWRHDLRGHSVSERETRITEEVMGRLSTAQVTDITVDPGTTEADPLRIGYHVRVPGYAQRTAQRIFFAPSFFGHGRAPVFSDPHRGAPVCFPYAWAENDMVTIDLPARFHLENTGDIPALAFQDVAKQTTRVRLSEDGHQLQCIHSFLFGERGAITFPVDDYPELKKAFDDFHTQDETVLSLVADDAAH